MGCERVTFPDGAPGFICGRRRRLGPCVVCQRPSTRLCDWPTAPGRTCSARLCDRCAVHVGPDRDHCPTHDARHSALEGAAKTRVAVYTARVPYSGADRLDVTANATAPEGRIFAPSWAILRPAIKARRHAEALRQSPSKIPEAEELEARTWAEYVPAYLQEMRASYRAHRAGWDALLARESVTLVCYCTDAARCHRTVLSGILGKLGATERGER